MTTQNEAMAEYQRLRDLMNDAAKAAMESEIEEAHAENAYRKGKSKMLAERLASGDPKLAGDRAVMLDADSADLRLERDMKRAISKGMYENSRNYRQQLSALQTIANLERAEAEFARTGNA